MNKELTAELIKAIRAKTGAGVNLIKLAYENSDGSEEQIFAFMKAYGQAIVVRQNGRILSGIEAAKSRMHLYLPNPQ